MCLEVQDVNWLEMNSDNSVGLEWIDGFPFYVLSTELPGDCGFINRLIPNIQQILNLSNGKSLTQS